MVLVTGGTGQLGRALVGRLVAAGHRVRVLSRSGSAPSGEAWPGDVTRPETLEAACRGVEVVFHLAALVDHHAPPAELERVNAQGSVNVAEAALRAGVRRLVHCSSVAAEPGVETTDYGRSKIEAERRLAPYKERLPIVTLRPGPVYHEGRKAIRLLVRWAARTGLVPRAVPDVTVHVASLENVTDAFLLAMERGRPGRAYAICDDAPVSRSSLSAAIARETGARAFPVVVPAILPAAWAAVLAAELLRAVAGVRPPFTRHFLRTLTRSRAFDLAASREDLGFAPAPTDRHFAEAVRRCLAAGGGPRDAAPRLPR